MEDTEEKRIIAIRDLSIFLGLLSFAFGYILLKEKEAIIPHFRNATIASLIFAIWGCLQLYWSKLGLVKSKFQSRTLIVAVASIVGAIIAIVYEILDIVKQ